MGSSSNFRMRQPICRICGYSSVFSALFRLCCDCSFEISATTRWVQAATSGGDILSAVVTGSAGCSTLLFLCALTARAKTSPIISRPAEKTTAKDQFYCVWGQNHWSCEGNGRFNADLLLWGVRVWEGVFGVASASIEEQRCLWISV